jgi:hypothetical protein
MHTAKDAQLHLVERHPFAAMRRVGEPSLSPIVRSKLLTALSRTKLFGDLDWNGNDNQSTVTIVFDIKGAS